MAANNRTNNFASGRERGRQSAPTHSKKSAQSVSKVDNINQNILNCLVELFGQVLDEEVIYSVGENYKWNVESCIETLIAISEGASLPVSGHSQTGVDGPKTRTRNKAPKPVHMPNITPALAAIKVAYQGYDDDLDDADIVIEGEEEFEVVMNRDQKLPSVTGEQPPSWQGSSNFCLREVKKVPKQCPVLSKISKYISNGNKILVLMRGCPGSGKSYLAYDLIAKNIGSSCDPYLYIFSTDNYFHKSGKYVFNPNKLSDAHEWNQSCVITKMKESFSPIIVDNTNTTLWEMKPYALLAVEFGYALCLLEPTTPWRWKESELFRRNTHGVARASIRHMLDRYEKTTAEQLLQQYKLSYNRRNTPPQPCSNPVSKKVKTSTKRVQNSTNNSVHSPIKPSPTLVTSNPKKWDTRFCKEEGEYSKSPNKVQQTKTAKNILKNRGNIVDIFSVISPLPQRSVFSKVNGTKPEVAQMEIKPESVQIVPSKGDTPHKVDSLPSFEGANDSVEWQLIEPHIDEGSADNKQEVDCSSSNSKTNKNSSNKNESDSQSVDSASEVHSSTEQLENIENTPTEDKFNSDNEMESVEKVLGDAFEHAFKLPFTSLADKKESTEIAHVDDSSSRYQKDISFDEQSNQYTNINTCLEYMLVGPNNTFMYQKFHEEFEKIEHIPLTGQESSLQIVDEASKSGLLPSTVEMGSSVKGEDSLRMNELNSLQMPIEVVNCDDNEPCEVKCTLTHTKAIEEAIEEEMVSPSTLDQAHTPTEDKFNSDNDMESVEKVLGDAFEHAFKLTFTSLADKKESTEIAHVDDSSSRYQKDISFDEQSNQDTNINTCLEYLLVGPNNTFMYQKFHEEFEKNEHIPLTGQESSLQIVDEASKSGLLPSTVEIGSSVKGEDSLRMNELNSLQMPIEVVNCDDNEPCEVKCTLTHTKAIEEAIEEDMVSPSSLDEAHQSRLAPPVAVTEHESSGPFTTQSETNVKQSKQDFAVHSERLLPKLNLLSWFFSKKKTSKASETLPSSAENVTLLIESKQTCTHSVQEHLLDKLPVEEISELKNREHLVHGDQCDSDLLSHVQLDNKPLLVGIVDANDEVSKPKSCESVEVKKSYAGFESPEDIATVKIKADEVENKTGTVESVFPNNELNDDNSPCHATCSNEAGRETSVPFVEFAARQCGTSNTDSITENSENIASGTSNIVTDKEHVDSGSGNSDKQVQKDTVMTMETVKQCLTPNSDLTDEGKEKGMAGSSLLNDVISEVTVYQSIEHGENVILKNEIASQHGDTCQGEQQSFEFIDSCSTAAMFDLPVPDSLNTDFSILDAEIPQNTQPQNTELNVLGSCKNPSDVMNLTLLHPEITDCVEQSSIITEAEAEAANDSKETSSYAWELKTITNAIYPAEDTLTGTLADQNYQYSREWSEMTPSNFIQEEAIPVVTSTYQDWLTRVTTKESETNTSYTDFLLVEQECVDGIHYLAGQSRCINVGMNCKSPPPVQTVSKLDKGSMTAPDDFDEAQPDFELLVNMFPKIPRELLKELFDKCNGEINWTVDLLLESGHAFEPSENLEIRFHNTKELQVTQQLLEELDLKDMQMSTEIQEGSSVTNINEPSTSSVQENEDVVNPEKSILASLSKKNSKKPVSELSLRLKKEMEQNIDLKDSSYSEHTLRIKKMRHGYFCGESEPEASSAGAGWLEPSTATVPSYTLEDREFGQDNNQNLNIDGAEEEEENVALTFGAELIDRLQDLFGQLNFPYPDGIAPVVDVPMTLARQIYSVLMDSQQKQFDMQEKYFEDMIKDEEFARRLQEEEMPPPDFRQIMDMELALEQYKAESAQLRVETKDDMATKLSKKKLTELFPTVDPAMLFDVFAAHGNSFQETLEVLEASTVQPNEAVRTVMSPEALLQYEKQLIEQAKQESLKQRELVESGAPSPYEKNFPRVTPFLSKEQALHDADFYRQEANRQYQLRNAYYQKANDALRNGQKAVASYYAQVGQLYKQYIERANACAAASLLTAHTMSKTSTTLDLHYLFVVEALQALDIFIDHHISKLVESGKSCQQLFLITGSGNHSAGGRPKIKPAVQKLLTMRGIRYTEINHGHLKIVVTKHMTLSNGNSGTH